MQNEYEEFLRSKAPKAQYTGIEPKQFPSHMRDYQKDVTAFSIRAGCSGNFLDTGLGKTVCELEWCCQTAEASNGKALLLTPLAVARQIEKEAKRFGYTARVIRDQRDVKPGINICNYDRLHLIEPASFGAVALDESSILKSFTGKTSRGLIDAFTHHRFRLCATATPAPNDHMELGQHSQFLGQMSAMEMLAKWFINDTSTASQQWRLKKHAVNAFWEWMALWCRCAETPADLGYDASKFVLPPLHIKKHLVAGNTYRPLTGGLFGGLERVNATNMHNIKRQTSEARADAVAKLLKESDHQVWVVWCDTDYEADALKARLPGAVEVRGSHSLDHKENALAGFADGSIECLITKASICGFGLNWQHCHNMAFVGRSFSYEDWYQAVRRFWRYGQEHEVNVHLMVAEGEEHISSVIDRKSSDHIIMKRAMARAMANVSTQTNQVKVAYNPIINGGLPAWLNA